MSAREQWMPVYTGTVYTGTDEATVDLYNITDAQGRTVAIDLLRHDATLVAAAPELLAFARAFLRAWETPALAEDLATQARAAITKATGETK